MEGTAELEGVVEGLYDRAGADRSEAWRPSALARAILGADGIVVVPGLREYGHLGRVHGKHVIAVRSGLPRPIREWIIGHELGHLAGVEDDGACDYIGAAIAMRRRPFLRALNASPDGWLEHAARFCVTTTSAVLRAGETDGRPLAVVTPRRVYARGEARWPDELTLRFWARSPAPPFGVRRGRLPDDPKRILLEGHD